MRNKCGSIFGDIQKPELGIREFTVFSNGIHLFALVIYIYNECSQAIAVLGTNLEHIREEITNKSGLLQVLILNNRDQSKEGELTCEFRRLCIFR